MGQLGSQVQKCPCEEERKPLKVRASLFFDGTLNNAGNVATGIERRDQGEKNSEDSYGNDYSNIARLERLFYLKTKKNSAELPVNIALSVYIEGAGTKTGDSDGPAGYALGMGPTGVHKKVEKGINEAFVRIVELVTGKIDNNTKLDIIVDVFGFSRGAATARYAIYKLINEQALSKKMIDKGLQVNSLRILFAGLFDTVASYGFAHYDDTKQLKLDSIASAEKILHLCAAEEHRVNFRLTNIKSAASHGKEVFLPGVHSDIGGGYLDKDSESVTLYYSPDKRKVQKERAWMLSQGWYEEGETEITPPRRHFEQDIYYTLVGERDSISHKYSYIPLQIMARYAGETGIKFDKKLKTKYNIPKELSSWYKELNSYVDKGVSWPEDWINRKDSAMKALRHGYLHFSAIDGSIAHKPEWSGDKRERVIQDG